MNKVKERIPVHLHKSTSIYLGATAGMRLLRYSGSLNSSACVSFLLLSSLCFSSEIKHQFHCG
uniref:Uncharacterized protein n=1 Tax=Coturnix japonica TaxID=93934 RepID=A0A8C2TLN4_COTJA